MAGIDPKFYYLTLGLLVLCTIVGLIVAYSFQREVNHDLAPPTEKDLLGPLEKAYYSGLMREEEFERIQEAMARQKTGELSPSLKSSKFRAKPEVASEPVEASEAGADASPSEVTPPPDGSDPGPSPG